MIASKEFCAALENELKRLTDERIAEYEDKEEFWRKVDIACQKDLDSMAAFFSNESETGTLSLYLSPLEGEAEKHLDLEKILKEEIADNELHHLEYILKRLEVMVALLRDHLNT